MAQNHKTRSVRGKLRTTDDEWHRIKMRAKEAGVPALRYVREAALGTAPARRRTAGVDAVVIALSRVQNNLRQLQTVAEIDDDEPWSARIGVAAAALDRTLLALPPEFAADVAERLVAEITRAGVTINLLTRQANTDEELPGDEELEAGLREIEAVLPGLGA